MPTSRKAKERINATKRTVEELPRAQDDFVEGFTWAEFHTAEYPTNKTQVKIDFSKENQIWHYLGGTSTEARAQYTDDPQKQTHNPKSNFLDSIPRPPPPVVSRPWPAAYSIPSKVDRPYQYKPKNPVPPSYNGYSYNPPHYPTQPHASQYGAPRYAPQPYTSHQFMPNGLATKPFPTSTSTFAPQPNAKPPYANQATPKATQMPPISTTPQTAPNPTQSGTATSPQTTPTSIQLAQPKAPHSAPAHSRNKSLPFGTGPRNRT